MQELLKFHHNHHRLILLLRYREPFHVKRLSQRDRTRRLLVLFCRVVSRLSRRVFPPCHIYLVPAHAAIGGNARRQHQRQQEAERKVCALPRILARSATMSNGNSTAAMPRTRIACPTTAVSAGCVGSGVPMINFLAGISTSSSLTPLPRSKVFVGGRLTFFAYCSTDSWPSHNRSPASCRSALRQTQWSLPSSGRRRAGQKRQASSGNA